MIKKTVEKAIIEQIKKEEHSSRLYLAMASWCEGNGFPGAAKYLYKQSDEERMHQLKFVHYLNERTGHALFLELEKPEAAYKSLLELFEKVLKHEQFVTASINKLYEISIEEKDYTTGSFLQWYITEQIEEESTVQAILDKMKLAGEANLYHIDRELEALAAAKVIDEI